MNGVLKRVFFLLIPLLMLFIGCSKDDTVEPPSPFAYEIPEETNDGWKTASAEDYNVDIEKLSQLTDLINYKIIKSVHSILIVKDGFLIFEEYFEGHKWDYAGPNHHGSLTAFDKNTIHNQASVTKSFASALIGIAIDKGYISSVDEKVFDYFPEYSQYNNEEKSQMSLEHLLTMTSGFEWNEGEYPYSDDRNDLIQMWQRADPLEVLVEKPLVVPPGTQFYYNSGCTNLLGEILRRATGFRADLFANKFLFAQLGISKSEWEYFSNGVVFVSGDLKISPRAMAKLGYLYLNKGIWNGTRIISEGWIDKSTSSYIEANYIWQYGYQWWLRTYTANSQNINAYSARGWGGQAIIVFPDLNVVIVMTGGNYTTYEPVDEIVTESLLPALL